MIRKLSDLIELSNQTARLFSRRTKETYLKQMKSGASYLKCFGLILAMPSDHNILLIFSLFKINFKRVILINLY